MRPASSIVMLCPPADDSASDEDSDSSSEISDRSLATVELKSLTLEREVNLNEDEPQLSRDDNTQDVTIADHDPFSPRVAPLDKSIEIINVPRPDSPISYTRWMDLNIGEEVQIDFGYFLKYYHHKLNLTRPSFQSFVQHDVTGLSRLTAKVSKKGTNELRFKWTYEDGEEDPFVFGDTHISLAVEVDHSCKCAGSKSSKPKCPC